MALSVKYLNKRGFTLVELLIASALTGIIGISLYGVIRSALKLHNRTNELSKLERCINQIMSHLEIDLGNCISAGNDDAKIDSNSLTFDTYTAITDSTGYSYLRKSNVTYDLFNHDDSTNVLKIIYKFDKDIIDSTIISVPEGYTIYFEPEVLGTKNNSSNSKENNGFCKLKMNVINSSKSSEKKELVFEKIYCAGK
jgi:prepilin-type N-terminal cleavage/methylation domain-containing protein